jgi:Zn-dependent protease with chaperone function
MARSPGMSQALARSPGLFVSTVLTCMVGALLPPLPGLTLFVGGLGVMVVLCAGGLERPAVRLLGGARVLSEVEAAALGPAIALLCQRGLGPPLVELYARDGEVGIGAGAAGRRSVVVSAGLLRAAQMGRLSDEEAAGVIAAAVGRIRLGQTRFDVAVELWTIPWQLVRAVTLAIAKTVGWLPLTRFAWRIRFLVATVAVAQSAADDRIAGGLVVAAFIALTYLAPRWQGQWDMRSQNDSDRFVADHDLGDALGRFLRRCPPEPRTLERIHRLTRSVVHPSLALVVSEPVPRGRG